MNSDLIVVILLTISHNSIKRYETGRRMSESKNPIIIRIEKIFQTKYNKNRKPLFLNKTNAQIPANPKTAIPKDIP